MNFFKIMDEEGGLRNVDHLILILDNCFEEIRSFVSQSCNKLNRSRSLFRDSKREKATKEFNSFKMLCLDFLNSLKEADVVGIGKQFPNGVKKYDLRRIGDKYTEYKNKDFVTSALAANGTPIRWEVSTELGVDGIQELFDINNINIEVVHVIQQTIIN